MTKQWPRQEEPERVYRVLIADLVGLAFAADGQPDCSEVLAHVQACRAHFHVGPLPANLVSGIHFSYQPDLTQVEDMRKVAGAAAFDAVIAAATVVSQGAEFALGGVRIGAGTANMKSATWGGGAGIGGAAPLMNTPSINARATAQMVFKALLRVLPDLPVDELCARVVAREFDTPSQLREYPTHKLEGQRIAIAGFGNIGREVARLAAAFAMEVVVYARPRHKEWILSKVLVLRRRCSRQRGARRCCRCTSVWVSLSRVGCSVTPEF